MVVIRVREPIAKAFVWEFLRIHLTPSMLTGGEDEFYEVAVSNPESNKPGRCPACGRDEAMVGPWLWECHNVHCKRWRKRHSTKPRRGVVQVLVPHEAYVDPQEAQVSHCVLVLDRRYRETVLAAVYRTAGNLCDSMGWEMK